MQISDVQQRQDFKFHFNHCNVLQIKAKGQKSWEQGRKAERPFLHTIVLISGAAQFSVQIIFKKKRQNEPTLIWTGIKHTLMPRLLQFFSYCGISLDAFDLGAWEKFSTWCSAICNRLRDRSCNQSDKRYQNQTSLHFHLILSRKMSLILEE